MTDLSYCAGARVYICVCVVIMPSNDNKLEFGHHQNQVKLETLSKSTLTSTLANKSNAHAVHFYLLRVIISIDHRTPNTATRCESIALLLQLVQLSPPPRRRKAGQLVIGFKVLSGSSQAGMKV